MFGIDFDLPYPWLFPFAGRLYYTIQYYDKIAQVHISIYIYIYENNLSFVMTFRACRATVFATQLLCEFSAKIYGRLLKMFQ